MYLDRLRIPHVDIEATAANYSSLCTTYCPEEYETRMVEATAAAQGAKAKLSAERRHGATRQDYENQLVRALSVGFTTLKLTARPSFRTQYHDYRCSCPTSLGRPILKRNP